MSQDEQAGLGEKANVATAFRAMEAREAVRPWNLGCSENKVPDLVNVYIVMKNHHVSWLNPCESTKKGHFLVNVYITMENYHFFMGKVTFSVDIFSGYVPNFQRVPQKNAF